MQPCLREREETRKQSLTIGIVATVLVHAFLFGVISFSGLKYLYPPPEETAMLLDFVDEEVEEEVPEPGEEPQGEEVDLEEEVDLVHKSESPNESLAENLTPETMPDNSGDVEIPEPEMEEEPKAEPKYSFHGLAKADTSKATTPHSAKEPTPEFKPGQPGGNTLTPNVSGKPNAHLEGRKVNKNTLREPKYDIQESGIVVVKILVDQYGQVKKAIVPADGTTITNKRLWAEARAAALEAHFDQNADAPAMQEGTITYIFNLQ